ncbi:MAG: hypothetical protein LQ340_005302 [Diploschistes diacapsis]|nr:MAG: hypothetical protein LQ340_005302 [Diploschistes diacapsis]
MDVVGGVAALFELSSAVNHTTERVVRLCRSLHAAPDELAALVIRLRGIERDVALYRQATQTISSEDGFESLVKHFFECFQSIDSLVTDIQLHHGLDDLTATKRRRVKWALSGKEKAVRHLVQVKSLEQRLDQIARIAVVQLCSCHYSLLTSTFKEIRTQNASTVSLLMQLKGRLEGPSVHLLEQKAETPATVTPDQTFAHEFTTEESSTERTPPNGLSAPGTTSVRKFQHSHVQLPKDCLTRYSKHKGFGGDWLCVPNLHGHVFWYWDKYKATYELLLRVTLPKLLGRRVVTV